ncbi:MAG TPA: hypothetical protein VGW38_25905 [Chloroflexota bacterium]|nr:hypothetical protein [Chloroflexota bacterium]
MNFKFLKIVSGIATGLALGFASTAPALAANDEAAQIEAMRVASERFKDVNVALAEGYIADPSGMCITAEMEGQPAERGVMGIHYFRPDLLGITATTPRVDGTGTHTDFENPAVLVYEPQADGSLVLVAVENLVFEKAWKEAGNTAPPTFLGRAYVHMVDDPKTPADEAHGFEPHYELHAWVFRENPNGTFEPFNPNVTCEYSTANAHQRQ